MSHSKPRTSDRRTIHQVSLLVFSAQKCGYMSTEDYDSTEPTLLMYRLHHVRLDRHRSVLGPERDEEIVCIDLDSRARHRRPAGLPK